ncbi:MAG: FxsA family protein [Aeromonas sp.]|nr:FxsA family protein [Aeromonas sp.]
MGKFLLGLIGLFFVELWVLIKVGSSIGPLTTLILMVLAAMLGGQLVRSQGVMTLFNLQKRMQAGEAPGGELLQGIWLALAGFLFIFPGFVSDVFGLLLLQPTIRRLLTLFLVRRLARPAARGASFHASSFGAELRDESNQTDPFAGRSSATDGSATKPGTTIDGEYERKD